MVDSKEFGEAISKQIELLVHLYKEKYGDWGEIILVALYKSDSKEAFEHRKELERRLFRILDKPPRFPQYKNYL